MSDRPPPLQFLSPIHRATRQIGRYLEARMAAIGLSNSEGHLVAYLLSYGPCAVGELQRVFGLKGSTLTSQLDRLAEAGLVEREPHPDDRRSVLVGLSTRGRKAGRKVRAEVEALERHIRAAISARDLAGFRAVVEAIEKVPLKDDGPTEDV